MRERRNHKAYDAPRRGIVASPGAQICCPTAETLTFDAVAHRTAAPRIEDRKPAVSDARPF
jgi:hypothetical protein